MEQAICFHCCVTFTTGPNVCTYCFLTTHEADSLVNIVQMGWSHELLVNCVISAGNVSTYTSRHMHSGFYENIRAIEHVNIQRNIINI